MELFCIGNGGGDDENRSLEDADCHGDRDEGIAVVAMLLAEFVGLLARLDEERRDQSDESSYCKTAQCCQAFVSVLERLASLPGGIEAQSWRLAESLLNDGGDNCFRVVRRSAAFVAAHEGIASSSGGDSARHGLWLPVVGFVMLEAATATCGGRVRDDRDDGLSVRMAGTAAADVNKSRGSDRLGESVIRLMGTWMGLLTPMQRCTPLPLVGGGGDGSRDGTAETPLSVFARLLRANSAERSATCARFACAMSLKRSGALLDDLLGHGQRSGIARDGDDGKAIVSLCVTIVTLLLDDDCDIRQLAADFVAKLASRRNGLQRNCTTDAADITPPCALERFLRHCRHHLPAEWHARTVAAVLGAPDEEDDCVPGRPIHAVASAAATTTMPTPGAEVELPPDGGSYAHRSGGDDDGQTLFRVEKANLYAERAVLGDMVRCSVLLARPWPQSSRALWCACAKRVVTRLYAFADRLDRDHAESGASAQNGGGGRNVETIFEELVGLLFLLCASCDAIAAPSRDAGDELWKSVRTVCARLRSRWVGAHPVALTFLLDHLEARASEAAEPRGVLEACSVTVLAPVSMLLQA